VEIIVEHNTPQPEPVLVYHGQRCSRTKLIGEGTPFPSDGANSMTEKVFPDCYRMMDW
jgi:hypothetical protein